MAVYDFVQNHSDLSNDQGFQFQFHCDECGNGFMSTFQPNKLEIAGGFLRAAGSLFGGVLGNAGSTEYYVERAVGGSQHNAALLSAQQEVLPLFAKCGHCGKWVCRQACWDTASDSCRQCAQTQAQTLAASQSASFAASPTSATVAACPQCGASTTGGKFCTECGANLAQKHNCPQCSAEIPSGAKFCPECGAHA